MYTTSSALLEALAEAGVECLFANFGSDHTAIIEAIAAAREERRPLPRVYQASCRGARRNSRGVTPKRERNTRPKCVGLLNP